MTRNQLLLPNGEKQKLSLVSMWGIPLTTDVSFAALFSISHANYNNEKKKNSIHFVFFCVLSKASSSTRPSDRMWILHAHALIRFQVIFSFLLFKL
jgi:hypothetical protein